MLNAIINLSYLLSNADCPLKRSECAGMLRDNSTMLMGLMKNMLDASKVGAGKLELEEIDFDLTKLVNDVVNMITHKATEKALEVHVHIPEKLPTHWRGDPLRIRQILINLLTNAVKFTDKGGIALYVTAKPGADGNDQLCITVTDTGVGISQDALKKIFNKYTQGDASVSRLYGGTGLGLAISQDLAHLMQGDITVKSWPGMGSHFVLSLPLMKVTALLEAA